MTTPLKPITYITVKCVYFLACEFSFQLACLHRNVISVFLFIHLNTRILQMKLTSQLHTKPHWAFNKYSLISFSCLFPIPRYLKLKIATKTCKKPITTVFAIQGLSNWDIYTGCFRVKLFKVISLKIKTGSASFFNSSRTALDMSYCFTRFNYPSL